MEGRSAVERLGRFAFPVAFRPVDRKCEIDRYWDRGPLAESCTGVHSHSRYRCTRNLNRICMLHCNRQLILFALKHHKRIEAGCVRQLR